jgi:hypothetical protein
MTMNLEILDVLYLYLNDISILRKIEFSVSDTEDFSWNFKN